MADNHQLDNLLRQAALAGREAKVRELLEIGASPNASDRRGNTPLLYASMHGFVNAACILIERGADVNAANIHGYTPLASAALRHNSAMLALLLDAGAKPHARISSLGEEGLLNAEIIVTSPEDVKINEL